MSAPEARTFTGPTVVVTVPRPPSANRMFQRRLTKKGKRNLTPEYKEWRDRAGWLLKTQIVGVPEIVCRFNVAVEVPITRMDTDNFLKPLLDLCQSTHLISNDGNQNRVTIIPAHRDDCMLAFWPLPEMDGVRKPAKVVSYRGRPAPKPGGLSVKKAHGLELWK
jgi:Holliday junction resolvase RusA-like endonuclease